MCRKALSLSSTSGRKKNARHKPGKVPEQKDSDPLSMGQSLRLFNYVLYQSVVKLWKPVYWETPAVQLALVFSDNQCCVCTTKTKAV
ncbi:hypothetical protein F0266_18505 [Vibrio coralliilyticus]|nr:hypothetical protein [Vibrio coralliilyticus]